MSRFFNTSQDTILVFEVDNPYVDKWQEVRGYPISENITLEKPLRFLFSVKSEAPFFRPSIFGEGAIDNYYIEENGLVDIVIPNQTMEQYSIYPNPTKDILWIESAENDIKRLEIRAIDGRRVHFSEYMHSTKRVQLTAENLESGLYFLVIAQPSGQSIVRKLLKF